MDPAGTNACAQGYLDFDTPKSHTECVTDSEAGIGRAEDQSLDLEPCGEPHPCKNDLRRGKEEAVQRKNRDQYGWRKVIRNFTPSYDTYSFSFIFSVLVYFDCGDL